MSAQVLTTDDLEPLRRELAELRSLLQHRPAGEVLTTAEAATVAGVRPKTIREWVRSGALRGAKRGRLTVVRRADLDSYLYGRAPDLLSTLTGR